MKSWSVLCIATASILLTSCSASTLPSRVNRQSPLVEASCPPLAPLTDSSFGATTLKLIEVAGQYRECREAALGSR